MPTEHYDQSMRRNNHLKGAALTAATSAEARAEIAGHWPLDDMDEENYT